MVEFLDLPTDIWIYVWYYFLDAQDVISLLQTCRVTYALCSNQSLWAKKLKEVIQKDALFSPSFDLNTMSLNDCKRAVLAPMRMASIFESAQTSSLEGGRAKIRPASSRILPFALASPILMMLMVPGGRFLAVKTAQEILMVDVESNEGPSEKMRRKTGEELRRASSIFVTSPSIDGSKVRIATVENPGIGAESSRITVLEFDPVKRELYRLASRHLDQVRPHNANVLLSDALAGQLFCYYSDGYIFAWNFLEDVFLSWYVDPTLHYTQRFRKLVIDHVKKLLILFADQTLLFWDINDILCIKESGRMATFLPKWSCTFDIHLFSNPDLLAPAGAGQSTFICSHNTWYHQDFSLPGFDLLAYEGHGPQVYYHTYEIEYDATGGDRPVVKLAQMHDVPQFRKIERSLVTKQSRLCGGKTILLWENHELEGLFALIRTTKTVSDNEFQPLPLKHAYLSDVELVHPANREEDNSNNRVRAHLVRWNGFGASSFDPASGRLCTTGDDKTKVVVTDYLGDFGISKGANTVSDFSQ
ncbi:hypothetical protein CVT24_002977 [Panaeolus cyanescens]|uniref:F-box domain-containing protein n=1 Tax=Panaeolus cyanescens TaxID=181874 RepID=A0A409VU03_9AGAR|nr:hypothetical protein CVT24_002977 [Panaeolus cyanescens]